MAKPKHSLPTFKGGKRLLTRPERHVAEQWYNQRWLEHTCSWNSKALQVDQYLSKIANGKSREWVSPVSIISPYSKPFSYQKPTEVRNKWLTRHAAIARPTISRSRLFYFVKANFRSETRPSAPTLRTWAKWPTAWMLKYWTPLAFQVFIQTASF